MKILFFYFTLVLAFLISSICYCQSTDSVKLDPFNNYDSNIPPIKFNLDQLQKPVLFILDDKRLKGDQFSKLGIEKENLESITVIQDKNELEEMGYRKIKTLVLLKSKK